jgi:hypothetical protein
VEPPDTVHTLRYAVRVSLTMRFPMGATEFRLTDHVPNVGEVVARRGGRDWIAVAVSENADGSFFVKVGTDEDVELHAGAIADDHSDDSIRRAPEVDERAK